MKQEKKILAVAGAGLALCALVFNEFAKDRPDVDQWSIGENETRMDIARPDGTLTQALVTDGPGRCNELFELYNRKLSTTDQITYEIFMTSPKRIGLGCNDIGGGEGETLEVLVPAVFGTREQATEKFCRLASGSGPAYATALQNVCPGWTRTTFPVYFRG